MNGLLFHLRRLVLPWFKLRNVIEVQVKGTLVSLVLLTLGGIGGEGGGGFVPTTSTNLLSLDAHHPAAVGAADRVSSDDPGADVDDARGRGRREIYEGKDGEHACYTH